jgi:tetratricopeptide (TPR) repeat protein
MFDQVPVRVWLLITIAITAFAPARYVYRHIAASPSRRDITQPSGDLTWRTPTVLLRCLAALAVLGFLAMFIFTPTAEDFAKSPSFWPILIACMGLWAVYSVPRALITGQIEPFVRGFNDTYRRESQPKRFWASVVWNALLGAACVGLAYPAYKNFRDEVPEDRCYLPDKDISAQDRIAACNELIGRTGRSADRRADALAGRASGYFRIGDFRRSLADNSKAIELDPNASYLWFNRALIYDVVGDLPHAVADYDEAIRLDPDHADAHLNRGLIFADSGRFDAAIADLSKAHESDPKNVWALAGRGLAYAWKNNRLRAKADFNAARRIDPSNALTLRGEGLLAMNAGDMELAVQLLTESLKAEPNDRKTLALRADAYRFLDEFDKAKADHDRLEKLPPRWLPAATS